MKVISYNVNGIRAALKKGFGSWLDATKADVICLQEIKANQEQFDIELFTKTTYFFLSSKSILVNTFLLILNNISLV